MKKVALHNLGCKVNAYETEAMEQQLIQRGYEIVPFDEAADVYIVNTCSVTNIADRKSRQMLHRAKKKNPSLFEMEKEALSQEERLEELFYAIATMHSFSQKAIPYCSSFFTPRRFRPSPYFRSSI